MHAISAHTRPCHRTRASAHSSAHAAPAAAGLSGTFAWLAAGLALLAGLLMPPAAWAQLASPKSAGPGGKPAAVLVLSDNVSIDAQYEKELAAAGYRVAKASFHDKLSADFLRQFGVVLLTRLPFAGQQYQVGGQNLQFFWSNIDLLHDYLAAGGGILFQPAMSEFGEAYADIYDRVFQRHGLKILPQQLRDDTLAKGPYAPGQILPGHPVTQGLANLLYPINVLRWDNAYSTTPLLTDNNWTVLASGKDSSGTHQAIDNARVGDRLTNQRALMAIRKTGKGLLAATAVHSYYTLTHPYAKTDHQGENATGLIDGIPLQGEKDGRPSEWAKLVDNTLRFLAANSAANQIGAGEVPLPPQPERPKTTAVIDWNTAQPPPSWQHRVTQTWVNDLAYYDELPDPLVAGEIKYFKALVGARTAASSGKGTVKEYREAALAAGYSAIAFAETFADLTPEKWAQFVRDCEANSDQAFVCLPGLDIEDFQGGRYLVIGAKRYPDRHWLTPDGKKLQAVRMLSLGWYGHVSCVHRSGRTALHPKMYKHFQALSVYTYDTKGKLIDDALPAYQWKVLSDSNPIPIAAHEVTDPADVALAAKTGFQQILPAPTLAQAVDYFHFGLVHYFDCPLRFFISEGPTLEGWSMLNKDLGKVEENRDHYRLGIQVTSENPIVEATLYDGLNVAGRWRPHETTFKTQVDGFHDGQKEFMLLARDAKGRRVLSPGIRTTTRFWRLRCGDRQNWLGSLYIYTGWAIQGFGGYHLPLVNTREGGSGWIDHAGGGGNPAIILDFPHFSNHVQINDIDISTKYIDAGWEDVGGDAKPTYAVRPTDFTDGKLRVTHFWPKKGDFAVARADIGIRAKRVLEPDPKAPLFPAIASAMGKNDLLILPGKPPVQLSTFKTPVDLPAGSYVGGIITLSPGLRLVGRSIGFAPPPADTLNLHEGANWTASYLVLKPGRFTWRAMQAGYEVDALAEKALAQMGFAGPTPYTLTLTQGKLGKIAYNVNLAADRGGVAGRCDNPASTPLLFDLPLHIQGLNPRCASVVWRSDTPRLDHFTAFENTGLVTFDADKSVDFYAGNVATCDPALFVSVVQWSPQQAWFRVNNPTTRDITTTFVTAPACKTLKQLTKEITLKAGASLDVKE